jgi:hypothetical protein
VTIVAISFTTPHFLNKLNINLEASVFVSKFAKKLTLLLKQEDNENNIKAISFLEQNLPFENQFACELKAKKWDYLTQILKNYFGDTINQTGISLCEYVLKTHNLKIINDFANKFGVNTIDENGYSLMAYAIILLDDKAVEILLRKNPDLNLKFQGETLKDLAVKYKDINTNSLKIFELFYPKENIKFKLPLTKISTPTSEIEIKEPKSVSKKLAKQEQQKIFEKIFSRSTTETIGDLFKLFGLNLPREREKYFKYVKIHSLPKEPQSENVNNADFSWAVKGKLYSSKDAVFHNGYYMLIELDFEVEEKFTTAFCKGFASQALDDSGIKIVNTIMEIKIINSGDRVFARKYYVNDQGKKLVIFNEFGNHNIMDRITSMPGFFPEKKSSKSYRKIATKNH